jgi:hypothetical protein
MNEEIKLKRAILDAVMYLLAGMAGTFSQEESSIELNIDEAIKSLMEAQKVYAEWLKED